jgi:diketogulonate reductase-like aldo/keto reductase
MQFNSHHDRAVLNNNVEMPWVGLGVFQAREGGEVERAIHWALEAGYRCIDTASLYGNERGVGRAVRESGVAREQIFITTKVWNSALRSGTVREAFENSLKRLGLETLDLYLIHWPVENAFIKAWKVLEQLHRSGSVRAIGVSNFQVHHLETLLRTCEITPAVNQVEFHPYLVQPDLLEFCRANGILLQAWSPLMQGHLTEVEELERLGDKYNRTPAQIVLRWDLQHGVATIPKSVRRERIEQNFQVFDFELSAADMAALDALDRGRRFGPDPDRFSF